MDESGRAPCIPVVHDEIAWKKNNQRWMMFLEDYKNHGGRVTTGSDSGFIYNVYGFGLIRELELLQEAGFHPLEVVRAATLSGADLIVVPEDPLQNFKVLYGTGALKLNGETREVERVGKVKWTIKDGIVYDAEQLRADVRRLVAEEKERERREGLPTNSGSKQ